LSEPYEKTLWITPLSMSRVFYIANSPILEYKRRGFISAGNPISGHLAVLITRKRVSWNHRVRSVEDYTEYAGRGRRISCMPTCHSCGTENSATNVFCGDCGASLNGHGEYYVLHAVTQQRSGPLTEETVKEWIAQKRLSASDSVALAGAQTWTPLLHSPFAKLVSEQITISRLAATTCPRCGSGMVAVIRRSGFGLALILIGILLTPVLIGIPIFIVGMIIRHGGSGKTYLTCPCCKYSAS
jgi:hypothetical protein